MRLLEKIAGTAGAYVLTGTVSVDESGNYIARAATYRLRSNARTGSLRAVASGEASGPSLKASGISAPEARRGLCLAARAQLGAPVSSFAWRPILALVPTRPVRMRTVSR